MLQTRSSLYRASSCRCEIKHKSLDLKEKPRREGRGFRAQKECVASGRGGTAAAPVRGEAQTAEGGEEHQHRRRDRRRGHAEAIGPERARATIVFHPERQGVVADFEEGALRQRGGEGMQRLEVAQD